ncbi:TPA: hypothetical protein HH295_20345 [Xanthomonas vasicola pv. zeae]|nr:hypothetical protein [Xanthomonas vasicola pv. zeae]HHZ27393.1 hypothetical protein [Xanthomonas vasicola pv. zeae]HHZ32895.1 hypothetical protein [Xanthomonas vasicola pv. zeae]HHZ36674.1 hypothetical protein [Xanthomonas vasicola pv. zeae]HHZ40663.1 hypothetical protein [Xanthomonas vasicola pv. zeae]
MLRKGALVRTANGQHVHIKVLQLLHDLAIRAFFKRLAQRKHPIDPAF